MQPDTIAAQQPPPAPTRYSALNNYVLCLVDESEDVQAVSEHDLVIPAGAQTHQVTGMVVSAGPTCRIAGLGPGVRVLFPEYLIGERILGPDRKVYRALLDHQLLGYFDDDSTVDRSAEAVHPSENDARTGLHPVVPDSDV